MTALTTRDALTKALSEHQLTGRSTNGSRDTCSCGYVVYEGRSFVAHQAAALPVIDAATLADDAALIERVAADQQEAADSWGEPLPRAELTLRARTGLRALAAALTERAARRPETGGARE